MATCRKCRCAAVAKGADGYLYCDYCQQYAPKPVTPIEEDKDD